MASPCRAFLILALLCCGGLLAWSPAQAVEAQPAADNAATASTVNPPPAEEPLTTAPGPEPQAATKAKSPKPPEAKRPAAKPIVPIAPVKIPDATMRRMIIDKYSATATAAQAGKEALIKQSQTFPESPACVTDQCHPQVKAGKNGHEPAKNNRCLACHQQNNPQHPSPGGGKDFQLVAQGAALCATCHPKLQGKKFGHEPATSGECIQCHAPHGSDNPFLLPTAADNQEALCKSCHEEAFAKVKYPHGPVGLGACTFCHDPHESDSKGLLKSDPQALCFECHSDIAQGVKESPSVHEAVKVGGCATCHLPHGGEFPHLLKQEGQQFCFSCHGDIEERINKGKSRHAGLYLDRQCGTCHQPHSSPYDKLLVSKELDLCLSCHGGQKVTSAKEPKDISLELKKTFVHEPAAKGECSACHDPHGSKYQKLLAGPYPDTFYAPYDPDIYDLCFKCHDKELLTAQNTSSATAFRNGAQNLHYLHAAIPNKGRTCQTCHQAHASDGPKLISQTGTSFGEWQMSISYATTGSGGTCMPGCHRKMEYSRDKAISNAAKETGFGTYHVEYQSQK